MDDVGEKILDGFGFGFSADDESVVLDGGICFRSFEMEDGVVISEEVDFVDSEGVSSNFFDDVLDNFIVACLNAKISTMVLLTTLTFLLWLPFPPVLASPTFYLSFWILA